MKTTLLVSAGILAAGVGLAAALVTTGRDEDRQRPAIDIARGRALYADHCASCHGADLEGQPDWQDRLPSGRMPAPPHDATGHTWHHPDGMLLRITREGVTAVVGSGYESDMPAFGDILSDAEILDILTYIKSTWPERERQYQETLSLREKAQRK